MSKANVVALKATMALLVAASPLMAQPNMDRSVTQSYVVHRVEVPAGFAFGSAVDVNRFGEVPGTAGGSEGTRPFALIRGDIRWLDDLGGLYNSAIAINDIGQIAGSSQAHPWWGSRAVRWERDGSMTVIMPLTGDEHDNCWATGMNALGDIVGKSESSDGMSRAFLWSDEQGLVDLGTPGGAYSHAHDVNDHQVVVGWAIESSQTQRAFVWEGNGMIALPHLDPKNPESTAMAVNNGGLIVGGSQFRDYGTTRAVLWDEHGDVHDLGDLGGRTSFANDINEQGVIVGESDSEHGKRAFVLRDGVMRDLNDSRPANSDWVFQRALAISEDGRIVVDGRADGGHASFVLVPKKQGNSTLR